MTYPQMLSRDTGIGQEDLGNALLDRDLWKTVVSRRMMIETNVCCRIDICYSQACGVKLGVFG